MVVKWWFTMGSNPQKNHQKKQQIQVKNALIFWGIFLDLGDLPLTFPTKENKISTFHRLFGYAEVILKEQFNLYF